MIRFAQISIIPVFATMSIVGCDRSRSDGATPENGSAAKSDVMPPNLLLAVAPEGARDVLDAKKSARPGDEIVVRGRVGGRKDPFVAERALFTISDVRLPTCADNEGDSCATPWDYCCEPPDRVAAHTATVQVANPDGRALKLDLRAATGIKPMAEVVVTGRVSDQSAGDTLVVNATGIHVRG